VVGETPETLSEKLHTEFKRYNIPLEGLTGSKRVPSRNTAKNPPVVLSFRSVDDRNAVLAHRRNLGGGGGLPPSKLSLDDDLTREQEEQRRALWPVYERARRAKQRAFWRGGELYLWDEQRRAMGPVAPPSTSATAPLRMLQRPSGAPSSRSPSPSPPSPRGA
jgi:hypothetical protein